MLASGIPLTIADGVGPLLLLPQLLVRKAEKGGGGEVGVT